MAPCNAGVWSVACASALNAVLFSVLPADTLAIPHGNRGLQDATASWLEPDGNSTDLEELDSEGVPAEPLSRWSKVKNSAGNAKTFVMDADNLPIVLGVSVGAVVLIWLMCVVCYKLRKKCEVLTANLKVALESKSTVQGECKVKTQWTRSTKSCLPGLKWTVQCFETTSAVYQLRACPSLAYSCVPVALGWLVLVLARHKPSRAPGAARRPTATGGHRATGESTCPPERRPHPSSE